jgi:hypothetical protein
VKQPLTYIAAMKCLTREENGIETLNKAEGLLRKLESMYAKTKIHDTAKVGCVSAQYSGSVVPELKVPRRAEALLLEPKLSERDSGLSFKSLVGQPA